MAYFKFFQKDSYLFSPDVQKQVRVLSHYTAILSDLADDASYYTYYVAEEGERLDTISNKLYGTVDYYWTIPLVNSGLINTWNDLPKTTPELRGVLDKKYPGSAFIVDDGESLTGKFDIAETLVYGQQHSAILYSVSPTNGYLTALEVSDAPFPRNQIFTLTGSTTGHTIQIKNVIKPYEAPAYFTDGDGNRVRWNAPVVKYPTTHFDLEVEKNENDSRLKVIQKAYIYDIVKRFEKQMKRTRK